MFLDKVEIHIEAGKGGNGVVSFRREKFEPHGGPDGGDGGAGGSIYIVVDGNLDTLSGFAFRKHFNAENGGDGKGAKKHGKKGKDLLLSVPPGTMVLDEGGRLIADMVKEGERILVARGGVGGWGNARMASANLQAPRFAAKGEPGEEKQLILELRMIADVGIVGYPNVGKSTLLAAISAAKPEIADYPFTTKVPNLAVVEAQGTRYVVADIPGIIEGAHIGRGLGHQFLRHIQRCGLLLYLLDVTSSEPAQDLEELRKELSAFDPSLTEKAGIIAINKIDLLPAQDMLRPLMERLRGFSMPAFAISALRREGLLPLLSEVAKLLAMTKGKIAAEEEGFHVFHPKPIASRFNVFKDGDVFVLEGEALRRIISMTDLSNSEARAVLHRRLERIGVATALERAGAKAGDTIRCGADTWSWWN